ncbi:cephalosporin esterase [Cytidiella melzeri]|nr:cephalosporin esterase [Cytidiella melzeri]
MLYKPSLASLSFVLHGFASLAHCQTSSAPVVNLGYAIYAGTFDETSNVTNFLGMRYAAPPVGKLRFQAPAPPLDELSLGVQRADTVSIGCPQAPTGANMSTPFRNDNSDNLPQRRQTVEPEDCLFLNVFISGPLNPTAKMPVIVWIHGGGYVLGNTQGESGDTLISEAGGGIIVVNMDYRLGVFGFLPGSQVKEKGALNAGLLDQQAALHWVQDNIHMFGGDASEVTIWGESAGAGSVVQHMVAHGGNTQPPLFKGAITSSTFLPSQYKFNDPISEQIYSDFVQLAGCSGVTDTFDCLVNTDEGTLQNANIAINLSGFYGTYAVVPVVDGEFIQDSPSKQITSGILNGERLLMVTNTFEGTLFVDANFSAEMTVAEYVTQLFPDFNENEVNDAVAQYSNVSSLDTTIDKTIAIMGESIFICPTYLLLQSFKGPAFKAEFAIPPGVHGLDLEFYYVNGSAPTYPNPQFHASFAGAFMGFGKFGDPNVHPVPQIITPEWKLYEHRNTEMLFNRTEDFKPDIRAITTDPALLKRCEFWRSVAGSAAQ